MHPPSCPFFPSPFPHGAQPYARYGRLGQLCPINTWLNQETSVWLPPGEFLTRSTRTIGTVACWRWKSKADAMRNVFWLPAGFAGTNRRHGRKASGKSQHWPKFSIYLGLVSPSSLEFGDLSQGAGRGANPPIRQSAIPRRELLFSEAEAHRTLSLLPSEDVREGGPRTDAFGAAWSHGGRVGAKRSSTGSETKTPADSRW